MNPYTGAELSARLKAWHDAMVSHERLLRVKSAEDECDEECPHAEARELWTAALAVLGERAYELTFLRAKAEQGSRIAQQTGAER